MPPFQSIRSLFLLAFRDIITKNLVLIIAIAIFIGILLKVFPSWLANFIYSLSGFYQTWMNPIVYAVFLIIYWQKIQMFIFYLHSIFLSRTEVYIVSSDYTPFRLETFYPREWAQQHFTQNTLQRRATYIFPLYPHYRQNVETLTNPLIRALHFRYLFETPEDVLRYFIVSFFIYSLLFSFSMIPFLKSCENIWVSVLSIIATFGLSLYLFVNNILPYDRYRDIQEIQDEINDVQTNFLAYEISTSSILDLSLNNLPRHYKKSTEFFKGLITNIIQISMPIFFLAYISLSIHFHTALQNTNTNDNATFQHLLKKGNS